MDSWSIDQKRRHYLTLPWTVSVTLEDGDFVGRIAEFPGLVAVSETERELPQELYAALDEWLDALLQHGDPVAIPVDVTLPWDRGDAPNDVVRPQFALAAAYDADGFQSVIARSSAATSTAVAAA